MKRRRIKSVMFQKSLLFFDCLDLFFFFSFVFLFGSEFTISICVKGIN